MGHIESSRKLLLQQLNTSSREWRAQQVLFRIRISAYKIRKYFKESI